MTSAVLEAAETVERLCKAARHALDSNGEPLVCTHCTTVANTIRHKYRADNPVPPAVLGYFVINEKGLVSARLDEPTANADAQAARGIVVAMPATSDWRNVVHLGDQPWTARYFQHGALQQQEHESLLAAVAFLLNHAHAGELQPVDVLGPNRYVVLRQDDLQSINWDLGDSFEALAEQIQRVAKGVMF